MLTGKENLRETMKRDGNPDRYVKQYEFLHLLVPDTYYMGNYPFIPGSPDGVDQFGVTWTLPIGQMGAFPLHDDEHRVFRHIFISNIFVNIADVVNGTADCIN